MSGKSALVLGATGAVGKHVLRELIASNEFTRAGEFGRRVTPLEELAPNAKDKLVQKTIDFEKIEEAGLRDGKWDTVFITLASRMSSTPSTEIWEKIDREYVVNAARAAKTTEPSHEQRLVYVSSTGVNANSYFLYLRSKGLTENQLAELNYSDTIVFRPGFLANAQRASRDFSESFVAPLFGLASLAFSGLQISVSVLGTSIVKSGTLGSRRLPPFAGARQATAPGGAKFTTIGTRGAQKLAEARI